MGKFKHSYMKSRPNQAAIRRERKGIFVCKLCGQETTSKTGIVDPDTHIATCENCVNSTKGGAL